jgi:hypothetical protein
MSILKSTLKGLYGDGGLMKALFRPWKLYAVLAVVILVTPLRNIVFGIPYTIVRLPVVRKIFPGAAVHADQVVSTNICAKTKDALLEAFTGQAGYSVLENASDGMFFILKDDSNRGLGDKLANPLGAVDEIPGFTLGLTNPGTEPSPAGKFEGDHPECVVVTSDCDNIAAVVVVTDPAVYKQELVDSFLGRLERGPTGGTPTKPSVMYTNPDDQNVISLLGKAGITGRLESVSVGSSPVFATDDRMIIYLPRAGDSPTRGVILSRGKPIP